MPRGPKKHLKRLNAPRKWMLGKMDGVWAPKPSPGPHKMRECLPLCIILRNRLKYALTNKECMQICMERLVKVDGKVRSDHNYPAGFMDIVTMEKSNDRFRLMYDTKGRFVLHRVKEDEAKFKLCRVVASKTSENKVPVVITHDGRTIRYPDPLVKVNDTIKVDIASGKPLSGEGSHIKFATGCQVMLTRGHNIGRVGILMHVEKHEGSFDIVTVKDSKGVTFATRLNNLFVIGDGTKLQVSLPKGKGIKKNIHEEKADAIARGEL
jgi:ribosomal protein S4E